MRRSNLNQSTTPKGRHPPFLSVISLHLPPPLAMSVSSEYTEEEEEEFRDDMRVFLRLRPINKLEQSRRSKNCIELHEDPTLVTVDSPLEGEYDYTFDHVSLKTVVCM